MEAWSGQWVGDWEGFCFWEELVVIHHIHFWDWKRERDDDPA